MTPKITHIATLLTPWLGALVPSSLALAQNKADKAPQQKIQCGDDYDRRPHCSNDELL